MSHPASVELLRTRVARTVGGRLVLGDPLGAGASGVVFRAHDPQLQRDVALKVLETPSALSANVEEQFLREARIVAATEHPHIVPIYSVEAGDGLVLIVMRLLDGLSLAELLRRDGPMSPASSARVCQEVAEALALAHARGVVHRDIKPGNILLDSTGNAILTDFGISLLGSGAPEGPAGVSAGTPAYISPEQALAERVDGRSDVYALGVVLFELLTGRVPFIARDVRTLVAMHIAAPPPSVSAIRPEVPTALVTLVDRMLAKAPEDRPSAAEVVRVLDGARTEELLLSPTDTRRRVRRRRLRLTAIISASGAIAAVVSAGYLLRTFSGMNRALDEGEAPLLDASAPAIPDSVVAALSEDGTLRPGEAPSYVFVPARARGEVWLVLSGTELILRSTAGTRRVDISDARVDFDFNREKGGGSLVVSTLPAVRDTLLRGLTGVEYSRLRSSLVAALRASTARGGGAEGTRGASDAPAGARRELGAPR